MKNWENKRYYSLDYHLRKTYGEKLYKLPLNGSMTCPTRDGTLAVGGCIFCSRRGSGDFAGHPDLSITKQIEEGRKKLSAKYNGRSYIAYFQAFTNTYAPVEYLEDIFLQAIREPEVKILSIATRPDCLGPEILSLLSRLNEIKPVWVELGLQTIHEDSARFIRRGYELPVFAQAIAALADIGISAIAQIILGLPGESQEQMLDTIRYLNTQPIKGIKIHLLHILKDTDLATYYQEHPFKIFSLNEYLTLLGEALALLRPDIVVHRLTGDGPKELLIEPLWTRNKRLVLNSITKYLKELDIWQGKDYTKE